MTTDLLSVWTDPDTAMHAVGTSLGIFDEQTSTGRFVPTESPLRGALLDVLLVLVDDGQLEKRACADGRYAFRWRDGGVSSAVSTDAVSPRLDAYLAAMPRAMPSGVDRSEPAPIGEAAPAAPVPRPRWPRLVQTTAPLLLPTLSCLLALLAFVVLGQSVGLIVVGALALIGVVGVVRRVPLAGFWTSGLILAGLVVRLS